MDGQSKGQIRQTRPNRGNGTEVRRQSSIKYLSPLLNRNNFRQTESAAVYNDDHEEKKF